MLMGDGKGGFRALEGAASGIEIYGEQRGSAAGDFDGDGRVDLVVCQNGANTQLLHNLEAKPGLRVRLQGGEGNPNAIGAKFRIGAGEVWGPACEIHAGSGYWSQDSFVQVMALANVAEQIQVQWPGGEKTVSPISRNAREIAVNRQGQVTVVK